MRSIPEHITPELFDASDPVNFARAWLALDVEQLTPIMGGVIAAMNAQLGPEKCVAFMRELADDFERINLMPPEDIQQGGLEAIIEAALGEDFNDDTEGPYSWPI